MTAEPTPTVSPAREARRRSLAFHAALLFLVGGLTGGLVGAAMQAWIAADARIMLAAHMNALLGAFWLLGVAWSLRFSRLGPGAERAMALLALTSGWGNWAITVLKAFLHVHGVGPTGNRANDAIFGLLSVFVVLPTLGAAGLWAWGLRGAASAGGRE